MDLPEDRHLLLIHENKFKMMMMDDDDDDDDDNNNNNNNKLLVPITLHTSPLIREF